MKIRYRIVIVFLSVAFSILIFLCAMVFIIASTQRSKIFEKRLQNRALTVASIFQQVPEIRVNLLKKLDSVTHNLLEGENISIYNNRNERIYRYARSAEDTLSVDIPILNETRIRKKVFRQRDEKELVAIYSTLSEIPVVVVVSATDIYGRANLNDLLFALGWAFLAGMIISGTIAWIFSGRLLIPLKRITEQVNRISASNFENRLPESRAQDEWKELSHTFNHLLNRLQESFEIQGRFIANASHELSTPLTSIRNQIDVSLRQPRDLEAYQRVLRSIKSDTQHLSSLVHQLLDIARTGRGGAIQLESVRVDELLMEVPLVMKKVNPAYLVKTHFEELPDDESLCTVSGNRELLWAAIRNISENGCKYSNDHSVQIDLTFRGKKIIVEFVNKASGTVMNDPSVLFQPFQRGNDVKTESGHGLGLSLTRRIILMHKGEISAEIQGNDTFRVSISLPSVAEQ